MKRTVLRNSGIDTLSGTIKLLAKDEYNISSENVRILIAAATNFFRLHLITAGYTEDQVRPLTTKFRDAGRRSAPWQPASKKVPGRPQDGADGNRQARWLFDPSHKFYADEVSATLVEVKYIFQTLSMHNAPALQPNTLQDSFLWLLKHKVEPGLYLDPIQIIPIDLKEFVATPRLVQSGHLIPLDRGGRHKPDNGFLMLARSNQIQGNQTLDELLQLMARILEKHQQRPPELNVNPEGD